MTVVIPPELPYNGCSTHSKKHLSGGFTIMGGPALMIVDNQGIFLADLFGFIISLPVALFLVFWLSAVKRRAVVVLGAFVGSFIGFLIILGWVGTLVYDTVLPGASPASTFFGSLLFNSALGLGFGILFDLIVARLTASDYRRPAPIHE
jgi:hypothetical protein